MIHLLDNNAPKQAFPDPETAEKDPNGLLAVGGDLSTDRLINAYRSGIFPWFNEGEPILWWSPDPRMVLIPDMLKVSRSLRKTLRKNHFYFTVDRAFEQVLSECAKPRDKQSGTWITPTMHQAYVNLHKNGYAHSIEAWHQGELAGGLYGVAIGKVFFGESMFTRVTDASKSVFCFLADILRKNQVPLLDCQIYSEHLESLGACPISRRQFTEVLEINRQYPDFSINWPDQVIESNTLNFSTML